LIDLTIRNINIKEEMKKYDIKEEMKKKRKEKNELIKVLMNI